MSANPAPTTRAGAYWRAGAIALMLLLAVGIAAGISMFEQFVAQIHDLQQKVQKTAQLQYVAVLLDDKGEPAMLVTQMAGENVLQLQRLNAVLEGREDSMQLWALPTSGTPASLGVVQSTIKTPRLEIGEQALTNASRLAISVESRGGVPQSQGPRLPYLFSGALVRKAL
ncbi:anti-sigma factor [Rhodoferax sp. GW822-FHT02A01]|uniref:anti-sigma factor domain-containing protein n=1 Tax=Rhodoferax sp. GW822-FHT02A01 TaxID=3141537 RepID=UPI00315D3D93